MSQHTIHGQNIFIEPYDFDSFTHIADAAIENVRGALTGIESETFDELMTQFKAYQSEGADCPMIITQICEDALQAAKDNAEDGTDLPEEASVVIEV